MRYDNFEYFNDQKKKEDMYNFKLILDDKQWHS